VTVLADRLAYAALLTLALCVGLGDVRPSSPLAAVQLLLPVSLTLSLAAVLLRSRRTWRWPRRTHALGSARPLPKLIGVLPSAGPGRVWLALLVWLAVQTLSALLAPAHRQAALWALERPFAGALLAMSVCAMCRDAQRAIGLAKALATGGLVVAVVGLAQASGNAAVGAWLGSLHDGAVPIGDVPRVASTLSHPNVAAIVLELTLPLAIAWWWSARPVGWASRLALGGAMVASLLALVLTFSRAGLLAALVALALMAAASLRQRCSRLAQRIGALALLVPLALAWTALADDGLDRRLTAGLEESGATSPARPVYWSAALAMTHDHPLLGVGPDNYRWEFAGYSGVDVDNLGVHAHNQALEALADTGVLGFAALAWLVAAIALVAARGVFAPGLFTTQRGTKRFFSEEKQTSAQALETFAPHLTALWVWRLALLASLCAWLAHGLLDDFERFWPASAGFWLTVGLAVRLAGTERAQQVQQALGRVALGRESDPCEPRLAPVLRPPAQRDDVALGTHRAERGQVPDGQPWQGPIEQDHVAPRGDDLIDQRLAGRGLTHD
jgi:O-antigen ligase